MLDLYKGCECPQKSIFAAIFLYAACVPLGALFGKKNNAKAALVLLLAALVLGLIWYLLLQWCCEKKYNTVAWVLIGLQFLYAIYQGYAVGNMQELDVMMSSVTKKLNF